MSMYCVAIFYIMYFQYFYGREMRVIPSITPFSLYQSTDPIEPDAASITKQSAAYSLPLVASSTQNISTLTRQLSASAELADVRDKTLTRSELATKAAAALNQIQGENYFANKVKNDSEVPNTDDQELLARAKQATAYINSAAQGNKTTNNPFAGLSREQLSNIIYDDTGIYTINERRAALYEESNQEENWRKQVVFQSSDEYNSTGTLTKFFRSVLDHYNSLPAIEKAQYPANYESDLESKINQNLNYRTGENSDLKLNISSLFDLIGKHLPHVKTIQSNNISEK